MKGPYSLPSFLLLVLLVTVLSFGACDASASMLVRIDAGDPSALVDLYPLNPDVAGRSVEGTLDLIVDHGQYLDMLDLGYSPEIIYPDMDEAFRDRFGTDGDLGDYHTYSEMIAEMQSIHNDHPTITTDLIDIGDTYEGRAIYAMKVSDNPDIEEDEPEALIIGCHHARELITVEIPLHLLNYLTDNYSNPRIQSIVNNRQVWVIPMMNVDGHMKVENGWSDWRKNTRPPDGVDLNRNYSYKWGYDNYGSSPDPYSDVYRGTAPFSEPESQAIRDLVEDHDFQTSLSYHSYGDMLLFSYGYDHILPENDEVVAALVDIMNDVNNYTPGTAWELLYSVNGEWGDWMYGEQTTKNKIFAVTPEVGSSFWPPDSYIPTYCNENLEMNLFVCEAAANPYHVFFHLPPVIDPMGFDPDGNFTVSWDYPTQFGDYGCLEYELQEIGDLTTITEGAENGSGNWYLDGFTLTSSDGHNSTHSFFSGKGNYLDNSMVLRSPTRIEAGDQLTFWVKYNIENDWDFAYVDISTDGVTWEHLDDFTGTASSWTQRTYNLGDYAVEYVYIKFLYTTDTNTMGTGFWVDDIHPVDVWGTETTIADDINGKDYDITGETPGTHVYRVRGSNDGMGWGYYGPPEDIVVGSNPIDITATPDQTSVPRGEIMSWSVTVENTTTEPVSFDAWADLTMPGGRPYPFNPLQGPLSITLPGEVNRTRDFDMTVPLNAPLGVYTYTATVGDYPHNPWNDDSFEFEVTE